MEHGIKRGQLIEFTDRGYINYPPQDTSVIRYGVCVEDETSEDRRLHQLRVKVADGSIVTAKYIHSSGWAGWIPEGLESILEELEGSGDGWDDCDTYPEEL